MPAIATWPSVAFIEGTVLADLNTEYPPAGFNVGTILHARFSSGQTAIYQCSLNGANARYWQPLAGSYVDGVAGELYAPMFFAGGIAALPGTNFGFLANGVLDSSRAAPIGYVRPSGTTTEFPVSLRRMTVNVTVNTMATESTVEMYRNEAAVPGGGTTINVGQSGIVAVDVDVPVFAGDRFDIRVANTAGGGGNRIFLSASLRFAAPG